MVAVRVTGCPATGFVVEGVTTMVVLALFTVRLGKRTARSVPC